jgi:hypothetical protein
MTILLSSENVVDYLIAHHLCPEHRRNQVVEIRSMSGKNFNLAIAFSQPPHFLVKQEPPSATGQLDNELQREWLIATLIDTFPELQPLNTSITKALYFDAEASIVVFEFLGRHQDLSVYYRETKQFDPAIATTLGTTLANLHRQTFAPVTDEPVTQQSAYRNYLIQRDRNIDKIPNFLWGIEKLTPGFFGMICLDGIEFFRLVQRYEPLKQAIAQLKADWQPCCLIHADLKLSNVLIDPSGDLQIDLRIIDWEKMLWGDPIFDLANAIADYLHLWLDGLVVSPNLDLESSLRLAVIPLEQIQPSLVAVLRAYLNSFPEIHHTFPNTVTHFAQRLMQYTGFMLIERLRIKLEYHQPFDNRGICTLQVAKQLLCQPQASITSILGISEYDLCQSAQVVSV